MEDTQQHSVMPTQTAPEQSEKKPEVDIDRKSFKKGILYALLFVVIVLIGVWIYGLYWGGWRSAFIDTPARALHAPVMIVGGKTISYPAFADNLIFIDAVRKNEGAESQIPVQSRGADAELVLRRQKQLIVLELMGEKYGVAVKKEDVETILQSRGMELPTDQELAAVGFSKELYRDIILYPGLLAEKVGAAVAVDKELQKEIYSKAEDLKKRIDAGEDFVKLAKENSQDEGSAPNGGDLEWVGRGAFVPEFEEALWKLKPGEVSGIVPSQYGLHIIKLEGKRTDKKTKEEEIHARHILLKSKDFSEIADAFEKELSSYKLIRWH